MKCDKEGCDKAAEFHPMIELRGSYALRNNTPAIAIVNLVVCDEHRADFTVDAFATDEFYAATDHMADLHGKARPDRSRTVLEWLPVNDPRAVTFRQQLALLEGE